MAHRHAAGYEASPDAEIVALADINCENAQAFQAEHGGDRIYEDYEQMLEQEDLDIVSICTWPHLHAPMVIAAAEAGVKAIHCEKPMAPTWREARAMVDAAEAHGVQLTFDHQRRFGEPFRKAKALLDGGAIGDLVRLEGSCSNMFDWGTHWFDMLNYYNDETASEWVLAQVEISGGNTIFGVRVEGQGISHWQYANGVHGLLVTGREPGWGASNRLVGTEGVIEVGAGDTTLRMMNGHQAGWQAIDVEEGLHGDTFFVRAVLDLIDALETGREPELSARRALQATELIFATYESSRCGGRVDLPLAVDDATLPSPSDDKA
jgi:predicted dehydrogenase